MMLSLPSVMQQAWESGTVLCQMKVKVLLRLHGDQMHLEQLLRGPKYMHQCIIKRQRSSPSLTRTGRLLCV